MGSEQYMQFFFIVLSLFHIVAISPSLVRKDCDLRLQKEGCAHLDIE